MLTLEGDALVGPGGSYAMHKCAAELYFGSKCMEM